MLHDGEGQLCRVELAKLEPTADVSVVLVTSLILLDVSGQVRVDHADVGVVEAKADGHGSLVSLRPRKEIAAKY